MCHDGLSWWGFRRLQRAAPEASSDIHLCSATDATTAATTRTTTLTFRNGSSSVGATTTTCACMHVEEGTCKRERSSEHPHRARVSDQASTRINSITVREAASETQTLAASREPSCCIEGCAKHAGSSSDATRPCRHLLAECDSPSALLRQVSTHTAPCAFTREYCLPQCKFGVRREQHAWSAILRRTTGNRTARLA